MGERVGRHSELPCWLSNLYLAPQRIPWCSPFGSLQFSVESSACLPLYLASSPSLLFKYSSSEALKCQSKPCPRPISLRRLPVDLLNEFTSRFSDFHHDLLGYLSTYVNSSILSFAYINVLYIFVFVCAIFACLGCTCVCWCICTHVCRPQVDVKSLHQLHPTLFT